MELFLVKLYDIHFLGDTLYTKRYIRKFAVDTYPSDNQSLIRVLIPEAHLVLETNLIFPFYHMSKFFLSAFLRKFGE